MVKQKVFVASLNMWLRRVDVEWALKELNKPDFTAGDIVMWADGSSPKKRFVVVTSSVAEAHRAHWDLIGDTEVVVVGLSDGDSYSGPAEKFARVDR